MKNLADENDRVEIYIYLLNLTKHSCEKCNYMYTSHISYHTIPYHIISYHIISYHIISYHIISHIISYLISYHISYHIIYHISSCTVLEIETDLSCPRPRLTVEESIHTIGRKTHSCDWKELQSEDRHLTLAHGVIDLDVAVASFRWLLLFGLQHCEPINI
jgi:hypothetical protein